MSRDDDAVEVPIEERRDEWLRERVVDMTTRLQAGELGYEWVQAKTRPDGMIETSWVDYEDWLWTGIWSGITLLKDRMGADWEPHYGGFGPESVDVVPSAGPDELAAWFITYGNRERIFEGLISGGVDDGSILAMGRRCLELVPELPAGPATHAGGPSWRLRFGDLLTAAGISTSDVLAIRHTYRPDGLVSPSVATPQSVLAYTRSQLITQSKIPAAPPRWWFIFMAEGGRQCRLAYVYENRGQLVADPAKNERVFDLVASDLACALQGQLVIEWSKDAVNWAKSGALAAQFEVVEIADHDAVPFPGFDKVLISYATLQRVAEEPRYSAWRVALASVKGIYLIVDTHNGKQYVGKADGADGVLGRWKAYAGDGHGGNAAMLKLVQQEATHPQRYQFSLLQVFGPTASSTEIDVAEAHYKRALLTQKFGLNQN